MTPRRRFPSHRLYGVGTAFVLIFMLAPLLVVLGRQAEKERRGSIDFYPDWIFCSPLALMKDTARYTFSKEPLYSTTVIVLRCDEKGTIHWYERDSLRFVFPREQHDRFRTYFQALLRNISKDSTQVLASEVKFHPAATYNDVIAVLDAGTPLNYPFVISDYDTPRFHSDESVYINEHLQSKYREPLWICGTHRYRHIHNCDPPTGLAAVYDDIMEYFGFTPEMYRHNFEWFQ